MDTNGIAFRKITTTLLRLFGNILSIVIILYLLGIILCLVVLWFIQCGGKADFLAVFDQSLNWPAILQALVHPDEFTFVRCY